MATASKVLDGVSFTAEAGKTTAIVGPSGAGKSTLISLVPRFYDPSSGQVLIDGVDVATLPRDRCAAQSPMFRSSPGCSRDRFATICATRRPDATDAEIEEAARLANAHDFILAQPRVTTRRSAKTVPTLSGGQRQRVSIARALVRNAPILLLDEATSALDNESEAAVQKALESAMKHRTVLVIAHRLSTIAKADKIVVMQAGQRGRKRQPCRSERHHAMACTRGSRPSAKPRWWTQGTSKADSDSKQGDKP
jgi:subfamily B ATP-binding cassette protein MsbA